MLLFYSSAPLVHLCFSKKTRLKVFVCYGIGKYISTWLCTSPPHVQTSKNANISAVLKYQDDLLFVNFQCYTGCPMEPKYWLHPWEIQLR